MEIFNEYADLQDKLLLMIGDDDINKIKDLIEMSNVFLKKRKYIDSTLNLIGSVVYARPHLLHNAVKLLNLFDNIQIDICSVSELEDEETIIRQVIKKILLSLSKHKKLISDYDRLSVIDPIKFCKQYNYGSYLDFETIKKMPDDLKIKTRNTLHSASPIVQAMIDDKIDLLQDLISKNNIDINQKSQCSLFEMHFMLYEATPLEYSAFLGAINCFKFLLMKTKNINYSRLLEFAIAGGNIDIIHITEDESHDQSIKSNQKLLYLAILYMQNDLIDYILHSYKLSVDAETFNKCIYSSNYIGMQKLIEFGDLSEINSYGDIGSTPLDIAAFEGSINFFKFLKNCSYIF